MGRSGIEQILRSHEETIAFGKRFADGLAPNTILALSGELGSGKTTFVQGLALGLCIEESVQSPTFTLLNPYRGSLPFFHFDLYRLKNEADFQALGFEEYFHQGGICAIEWPERIASLLPPKTLFLSFRHTPEGRIASTQGALC